jgi:ABC-type antimicrobial peptide transport system permease subunit
MLVAFTMLALLIGALGLFGLAAYSAEQRRREIGIRKALGATSGSIVRLMSRELVALIGIATGVGAPIAYVFASRWLSGFSYRVTIDPGIYLLTIVFVSAVAWLAISYQAIRAARTDPAETLRSE